MNQNENFRYLNIGLPEDILRRKTFGDFEGAIRLIDRRLSEKKMPEALKSCLRVQREICLRLPEEYPYSREEAMAEIHEQVPDFTEEEFDDWVDSGKIGWIYIHGEMRFFGRFFQTMCKTEPAFAVRAGVQLAGVESAGKASAGANLLELNMTRMKEKGSTANHIRIRASMKLKEESFVPGMFVRAYLPIPADCEDQTDIVIEKIYPPDGKTAPGDALQRTVCWEENMKENHEFYVEYSYVRTAVYHDLSGERKEHGNKNGITPEEKALYTREEAPHIMFTPYIRDLAQLLAGGEADDLEKARSFYDFITLNMKYTFMPTYFNLENIAEACARNFTGDCGVFALLFLTLCRCAGIPARWQSGLTAEPDFCGAHDWTMFYVEPYGWLYADPSYGIAAVRGENEERRRFYFGNLDAYRMAANHGFQEDFTIPMEHWRADPYDNQVGEMETVDRSFSYEEFIRSKEVLLCEEIKEENR